MSYSRQEYVEAAASYIQDGELNLVSDYFLGTGLINLRDIVEFSHSEASNGPLPADAVGYLTLTRVSPEPGPSFDMVHLYASELASTAIDVERRQLKFADLDLRVYRGQSHQLALTALSQVRRFFRAESFDTWESHQRVGQKVHETGTIEEAYTWHMLRVFWGNS